MGKHLPIFCRSSCRVNLHELREVCVETLFQFDLLIKTHLFREDWYVGSAAPQMLLLKDLGHNGHVADRSAIFYQRLRQQ